MQAHSRRPPAPSAPQATIFWERIRQLQQEDLTVSVKVDSANKGGLLVKYGPYDGFVPVSQFGSVGGCTHCARRVRRAHPCAPGQLCVCEHMQQGHRTQLVCKHSPTRAHMQWLISRPPPSHAPQMVTVDMMESLIGYEIPVKFLEVDEVRAWLCTGLCTCRLHVCRMLHCCLPWPHAHSTMPSTVACCPHNDWAQCAPQPSGSAHPRCSPSTILHRTASVWCSATSGPAWHRGRRWWATRCVPMWQPMRQEQEQQQHRLCLLLHLLERLLRLSLHSIHTVRHCPLACRLAMWCRAQSAL